MVRSIDSKREAYRLQICDSLVTELLRHTHTTRATPAMVRTHTPKNLKNNNLQQQRICDLEGVRHTHYKSYSCNGAKHMSKTTSCTTTMTTIQICLLLPWLLRRHRCRHDADYADNDDAAMTPATLPTTTHFAAMTPTRDVFYIQSRPMESLLNLSFMYICGSA